MRVYFRGAHKGVPFEIECEEGASWDSVNPRNCVEGPGVFLGYGLHHGTYSHINYGEKHSLAAEGDFENLMREKQAVIVKNMKEDLGPVEWDNEVSCVGGDSEEDLEYMIISLVSEALKDGDTKTLIKFLEYAQVDFISKDLQGTAQGDFCRTLYFNADGSKISKADRGIYTAQLTEIENWVWGNVFVASVPLELCGGFTDSDSPETDENSGAMMFIHSEIDNLTKKDSGNFVVTVNPAEVVSVENGGEIAFNRELEMKIFVDSIEEVKTITGWYDGNAVYDKNGPDKSSERE